MSNTLQNLSVKHIVRINLPYKFSVEHFSRLTGKKKGRCFLASMNHRDYFGRFSLFSWDPLLEITYANKNLELTYPPTGKTDYLENYEFQHALDLIFNPIPGTSEEETPFSGFWCGFISYNACINIEPHITLPEKDFFTTPDLCFSFSDTFVIKDHMEQETYLILLDTTLSVESIEERKRKILDEIEQVFSTPADFSLPDEKTELTAHITEVQYKNTINKIRTYIKDGDVYQVNFAYPMSIETNTSSDTLFMHYLKKNPVDFAAFLNYKHGEILSISPECFFTLYGDTVKSYPIKGTIKRGETPEADYQLRKTLINSEKDRAELSMIVDLIRNDIGRACEIGSVKVKQHASLETYHTLYHLYSCIQGKYYADSRSDLLISMFPGGSITGAPKVRAMEIISELENYKRNIYTGSVGWAGYSRDMSFNIAIRTIQRKGNKLLYYTGGGIIIDSDPQKELEETFAKAKTFHNIFSDVSFKWEVET